MRRISGHDNCFFNINQRDTFEKKKQPLAKSKSKGKLQRQNADSFMHPKNTRNRKTKSFYHNQSHQSSTHYTTNNSKKSKNNIKPKKNSLKKYQKQIMEVLHSSASVIQRQWRKYLIRKYRKSLELKEKRQKQKQQTQEHSKQKPLEKDQGSVSILTQQHSDVFNNQKYFSCHSLSSPKRVHENTLSKNIFSFNSSEKKFLEQPQREQEKFQNQVDSVSNYVIKGHGHGRSSSDLADVRIKNSKQPMQYLSNKKQMSLEKKTVQIKITGQQKQKKIKEKKKKKKYQEEYIHGDKALMQKMIKRYERQLQQKKLKQILSLQNRFGNNLMTFRSYQKTIEDITEDHKKKLCLIQTKKDKILNNWQEIIELYEKTVSEQEKWEDKPNFIPLNISGSDFSMDEFSSNLNSGSIMFEEWDAQSEKKQNRKQENNFTKQKNNEILIKEEEKEEDNGIKSQQLLLKSVELDTKKDNEIEFPKNLQINISEYDLMQEIKTPEKQKKVTQDKIASRKKQYQQELNKFRPINPSIDHVNGWLLQVSHYILDNHGHQLYQKLINVQQPQSMLLLQHCKKSEPYLKQYETVSQKVFKEFEYFNIKNLVEQNRIQKQLKDTYSALIFTFHRSLIDCLNYMLLDQLIYGRKWISYPWINEFKIKKNIYPEHPKQCLERAINRVSTIADYQLYPIQKNYKYGPENEEIHKNLICLEQVKSIPLQSELQRGSLIFNINELLFEQLLAQQVKIIKKVFDISLIFVN